MIFAARFWLLAATVAVALVASAPTTRAEGASDAYVLSPGDQLRVTVYGWQEISGKYPVGINGAIVLPLAGEIVVEGVSLAEAGRRIAEWVEPMTAGAPDVVVELTAYRDIYVIGAVGSPGAFPYEPGMTVIKAVARAGGGRGGAGTQPGAIIRARAEYETHKSELEAVLVRRARLIAEDDGSNAIGAVEGVRPDKLADLLPLEARLLTLHVDSLQTTMAGLKAQSEEFAAEIETLERQFEANERDTALLRQLLENQRELLSRAASSQRRVLETESSLLEYERLIVASEADQLQIRAFISRARQNVLRLEQEIAARRADREEQVVIEIRALSAEADRLVADVATSAELLADLGDAHPARDRTTYYSVLREKSGAETQTIDAGPDTPVLPGDVIEVIVEDWRPIRGHAVPPGDD